MTQNSIYTNKPIDVANGGTAQTTYTNGQLLIGNTTGNTLAKATLTAGSNVTITNGTGTITISASAGGLTWTNTTSNASIVAANGYVANKAGLLTMTLPATASVGDAFAIVNINTVVGFRIAQNASGYIRYGNMLTTTGVGGYLEATALGDSVECVCIVANNGWLVRSSVGNITVN